MKDSVEMLLSCGGLTADNVSIGLALYTDDVSVLCVCVLSQCDGSLLVFSSCCLIYCLSTPGCVQHSAVPQRDL